MSSEHGSLVTRALIRAAASVVPIFKVRTAQGPVRVPGTLGAASSVAWTPNWKSEIIARGLAARPGLFLDVGANFGQTLLEYHDSPARHGYVGFEPSAYCFEHLRKMVVLNGMADVMLVPVALSDANAVFKLFVEMNGDPGSTLMQDLRPERDQQALLVPAYRLDDIADTVIGERPVALIKIDVEGAEALTLAGMTDTVQRHRPTIICEVLHRDSKADAVAHRQRNSGLYRLIEDIGYRVFRIDKSRGGRGVEGYTAVDRFPDLVYASDNAALCDYLLVPNDQSPPTR